MDQLPCRSLMAQLPHHVPGAVKKTMTETAIVVMRTTRATRNCFRRRESAKARSAAESSKMRPSRERKPKNARWARLQTESMELYKMAR